MNCRWFGLLALVVGCGATPLEPRVTEVALTVADLDAATRWFTTTLGAESDPIATLDPSVSMQGLWIGSERVTLRDFEATTAPPDAVVGNDLRFQHLALVVHDIDRVHRRIIGSGIHAISPEPQTIPANNRAAAGIRAFYFREPQGHPLELIWYPPDKAGVKWQHPGRSAIAGIDHTAITVADTECSLAFYRDLLGLAVAGTSLNEGIEQARLSGVAGARVRITSLRGSEGMGVELLEYLTPGATRIAERPDPADAHYAETTIAVASLDAFVARAERARLPNVEIGPCSACRAGDRALLVRDPDGHAIAIVEE